MTRSRLTPRSKLVVGLVAAAGGVGMWRFGANLESQATQQSGTRERSAFSATGLDSPAPSKPEPLSRRSRVRADAARARLHQVREAFEQTSESAAWSSIGGHHATQEEVAASAPPEGTAAWPRMPPPSKAEQGKPTSREYIRDVVQEQFYPLATECYSQLLERTPQAAGTLVLAFEITGDSSVGGVVDEVSVDERTTLKDPEMVTCLRESMYGVIFDAPPEDGQVIHVVHPFAFSPEEDSESP